ncbi:hypothetical protein ACBP46_10785 [Paenalcaligenes hominis]|uniref:hypothetical protein n=1 Tax=Paenalcaligenes hominis TaxID=643674 RepID=UPI0035251BDC
MKAKYYKIVGSLTGAEALDYLNSLTGAGLSPEDFFQLKRKGFLPSYVELDGAFARENKERPLYDGLLGSCPADIQVLGLQRVCSHLHFFREGDDEGRYFFTMPEGLFLRGADFSISLEGDVISNGVVRVMSKWQLSSTHLGIGDYELVFNSLDIEDLAAKMNEEPDHQALQEENQRLSQDITELKATVEHLEMENGGLLQKVSAIERAHNRLVTQLTDLGEQHDLCMVSLEGADEKTEEAYRDIERLRAENNILKTENFQLKADDEINPREKETLYKLIAGMAIDGYRHNPVGRSGTVKEVEGALATLGIPLGERTIRKHLNAAIDCLPTKSI